MFSYTYFAIDVFLCLYQEGSKVGLLLIGRYDKYEKLDWIKESAAL